MAGLPPRVNDPERTRRIVGLILYVVLMLFASVLLLAMFLLAPLLDPKGDPGTEYTAMAIGAALALPALFVYLWLPWIMDRYDPEPIWALTLALGWGAIAACGFAAVINTFVMGMGEAIAPGLGEVLSACVSAPVVEEAFKGMAIFGMYYFVKREFDGVVDGIIYATFAALGFAAVENILYYGRAASAEMTQEGAEGALAITVFMRGFLSPWIHPLFTSMTGIGFGIARETEKKWVRWVAPIGFYFLAVFLHSTWNTAATISGMLTVLMLPLWLLFVVAFFVIVIVLVVRKGRIIRQHLQDEVLMGTITQQELEMVCSAWAHWRAAHLPRQLRPSSRPTSFARAWATAGGRAPTPRCSAMCCSSAASCARRTLASSRCWPRLASSPTTTTWRARRSAWGRSPTSGTTSTRPAKRRPRRLRLGNI